MANALYISEVGGANKVWLTGIHEPKQMPEPVFTKRYSDHGTRSGSGGAGQTIRQSGGVDVTSGVVQLEVEYATREMIDALNIWWLADDDVEMSPDGGTRRWELEWTSFVPERWTWRREMYRFIAEFKMLSILEE